MFKHFLPFPTLLIMSSTMQSKTNLLHIKIFDNYALAGVAQWI